MEQFPFNYQPLERTTWVYIASLMMVALYFKFSRLWSVRNLDLLGLIALGPGVVMATAAGAMESWGYLWLFAAGLIFMVRLLADPTMVRRPLLEPNLLPGGLTFMSVALMAFLMVQVFRNPPAERELEGVQMLDRTLQRQAAPPGDAHLARHGPAYPWLHAVGSVPARLFLMGERSDGSEAPELMQEIEVAGARTTAILAQLAVVAGLILIGFRHFGNLRMGVAMMGLYLLVPYTAQQIGNVEHVLPAAVLTWLVVFYRRPLIAGLILGLAAGAFYYPIFLTPLWLGFYWQRGAARFLLGLALMLVLVVVSLALTSADVSGFGQQFKQMFEWSEFLWGMVDSLAPLETPEVGFWKYHPPAYRITVFVLFAVLCGSLILWPAQKNLGTLLSCSAAVMLGTQFWLADHGGVWLNWYLPLLLLTVMRPNLEDRTAVNVLGTAWPVRRRMASAVIEPGG